MFETKKSSVKAALSLGVVLLCGVCGSRALRRATAAPDAAPGMQAEATVAVPTIAPTPTPDPRPFASFPSARVKVEIYGPYPGTTVLAGRGEMKFQINVVGQDNGFVTGLRGRLHAQYSDGAPGVTVASTGYHNRGQIIAQTPSRDGSFKVEDGGEGGNPAYCVRDVVLKTLPREGRVRVWAEVFTGGRVVRSGVQSFQIALPTVDVSFSQWQPSSALNTFERRVYAMAQGPFNGQVPNIVPVLLRIVPVKGVATAARASWLSSPGGGTVRGVPMQALSSPAPAQSPATAIQYWRDVPGATHQLNAYRVTATLDRARFSPAATPQSSPSATPNGAAP